MDRFSIRISCHFFDNLQGLAQSAFKCGPNCAAWYGYRDFYLQEFKTEHLVGI